MRPDSYSSYHANFTSHLYFIQTWLSVKRKQRYQHLHLRNDDTRAPSTSKKAHASGSNQSMHSRGTSRNTSSSLQCFLIVSQKPSDLGRGVMSDFERSCGRGDPSICFYIHDWAPKWGETSIATSSSSCPSTKPSSRSTIRKHRRRIHGWATKTGV